MNILLIKSHAPFHRRAEGVTPPLGIGYLASYLKEKEPDSKIKLIDMRVTPLPDHEFIKEVKEFKPDIVGISALTLEADEMHRLALLTKRAIPDVPIVVGGPHPTLFYEEVLKDKNIDYVVKGEGEITFHELVKVLSTGRNPKAVKGIYMRENERIIFTGEREAIKNLDELPFPAWDLLPVDKYRFKGKFTVLRTDLPYLPMFTSRACPYGCIYCHRIFGRGYRKRSPENVLEEMEFLIKRFGVKKIEIVDDIFNLDEDRVHRICEGMLKRNMKVLLSFPNGLRSDRLSRETLKLMRRAGTYYISFAIESASQRIQKLIKKNLDVEKALKAIEDAVKLRIFSMGYFMLGFPTETEKEMEETVKCAIKSKLHIALFFMVTPFMHTELYDTYIKGNETIPYSHYHYHSVHYNLSEVPSEKLHRIFKMAYLRFYSSPSRALRILRDYPFSKLKIIAQSFGVLKRFTIPDKVHP